MSEQPNPDGGRPFRDEELDWVADHLDEMRRTVSAPAVVLVPAPRSGRPRSPAVRDRVAGI
jgi:hypothetical protein